MSVLLEFSMFPTSDECRDGSSVSKQVIQFVADSLHIHQKLLGGRLIRC